MRKVDETSLKCSHEEVDSRILFHAKFIKAPNTLVTRTVDTDILVITLCNMPELGLISNKLPKVGLTPNTILRYINVKEINQTLGYRFCLVTGFLMFYHRSAIISNRHVIYELPHELPDDFRLLTT